MLLKTHIRRHERGLLFRRGDFERLLPPGDHWLLGRIVRPAAYKVEVADTLKTKFEHPMLDVLLEHNGHLRDALHVVDLSDTERALVWKDGRLAYVVGPGRHAFWKQPHRLAVETFDVSAFRFTHPRLATILQHPQATQWLDGVQVEAGSEALLYRDGVLVERLGEGLHVYWKHTGKVRFKCVDLREQVADVSGQEIITSDKVTLRVNLVVTYQVTDAVLATQSTADHAQALYREAQLALRAAVGTRTIDQLLADKESVGGEVRAALAARAAEFGVVVRGVGLRDIVLPGDMRLLLNQVVAASKEAEANLIRRREETASVRSQANTAKLLAENPALQRLKELELLKDVLSGARTTFVFGAGGNGDGDLIRQVKSLVAESVKPEAEA